MGLVLALTPTLAGAAAAAEPPAIPVPSGERVWWLDTIHDAPGTAGLTWRYRFVMPRLAEIVPSTSGPAEGDLTPEDAAELDALSGNGAVMTEDGTMMDLAPADEGDAGAAAELVDIEDLDLPDLTAADLAAPDNEGSMAVPAEPDVLLQDPVHADIQWLCENWVLPRLAPPAPLPAQLILSLSDRPTEFGAVDPDAVQLFEAFTPSADRKSCIWSPW